MKIELVAGSAGTNWRRRILPIAMMMAASASSTAQTADPTSFARAGDVQAKVADMEKAMKPDQGFAWQPLVRDGDRVAALEVWRKPGRPAVHPDEAEYATVIAGAGTLVSGGTLVDAEVKRPGLTEGSRIEGGTTRALAPGDVLLIPAGTPHWFGITGDRLVLLGTKLPAARATPK
ncbi:cupin domain-containing protein [Sphingosinicella sp. BN140058]|uniref:cupin domain-containing protein n=1 Tax=Sphingosinicella sp. BN140058 TaxID=1892855 RepID=UPI001FB05C09|nr:cupin domain-containing protein [Sphingosinicella sp. BN140058]